MLYTIGLNFFKIKVWAALGDMMIDITGLENVY